MTISNGSTISASDINTGTSTYLGTFLAGDNALVPLGFHVHALFKNVVTGTTAYKRKMRFVVPFDCYLETFAVVAADQTAASTVSAAITADGSMVDDLSDDASITDEGKLVFWPVKVSGTAGSGTTKLSRLLYDGTLTQAGAKFATANRAFRTLLKGSTITVSVKTTSTNTPSHVHAALVLRQFFARE